MNILFLEDDESRIKIARQLFIGHRVVYVQTVEQAIATIENNWFDLYSLDHDLGGSQMSASDEKSGFAVLSHIAYINRSLLPKYIIVHSFNPAGAENMMSFIYSMNLHLSTEITSIRALFNSKEYLQVLEQIL